MTIPSPIPMFSHAHGFTPLGGLYIWVLHNFAIIQPNWPRGCTKKIMLRYFWVFATLLNPISHHSDILIDNLLSIQICVEFWQILRHFFFHVSVFCVWISHVELDITHWDARSPTIGTRFIMPVASPLSEHFMINECSPGKLSHPTQILSIMKK